MKKLNALVASTPITHRPGPVRSTSRKDPLHILLSPEASHLGGRVLLGCAEMGRAEAISSTLIQLGFTVEGVVSGKELLSRGSVDCTAVFLDLSLQDPNWFEIAKRLGRTIPVFCFTHPREHIDEAKFRVAGIRDHFTFPSSPLKLQQLLMPWLSNK